LITCEEYEDRGNLRRLGRAPEATARIEAARALLEGTKDYPAERIRLDNHAYVYVCALGDNEAKTGSPRHALEIYEELLRKVLAWPPEPDTKEALLQGLLDEEEWNQRAAAETGSTPLARGQVKSLPVMRSVPAAVSSFRSGRSGTRKSMTDSCIAEINLRVTKGSRH